MIAIISDILHNLFRVTRIPRSILLSEKHIQSEQNIPVRLRRQQMNLIQILMRYCKISKILVLVQASRIIIDQKIFCSPSWRGTGGREPGRTGSGRGTGDGRGKGGKRDLYDGGKRERNSKRQAFVNCYCSSSSQRNELNNVS